LTSRQKHATFIRRPATLPTSQQSRTQARDTSQNGRKSIFNL
jgi:hypothetical protein